MPYSGFMNTLLKMVDVVYRDGQEDKTCQVQKCPVCNGYGVVERPPWITGDVSEWVDGGTDSSHSCPVCKGKGTIPIIKPVDHYCCLSQEDFVREGT